MHFCAQVSVSCTPLLKEPILPVKIKNKTTRTAKAIAATMIVLIEILCPFLFIYYTSFRDNGIVNEVIFKYLVFSQPQISNLVYIVAVLIDIGNSFDLLSPKQGFLILIKGEFISVYARNS